MVGRAHKCATGIGPKVGPSLPLADWEFSGFALGRFGGLKMAHFGRGEGFSGAHWVGPYFPSLAAGGVGERGFLSKI